MSNAADGYLGDYLPHKPKCSCADCLLERTHQKLAASEAREKELREEIQVAQEQCQRSAMQGEQLRNIVRELREEIERLKKDASWEATHRSELADLRDAFKKSETENASLRAEVERLKEDKVRLALELAHYQTKEIRKQEDQRGDGSERNLRLDAK